GKDASPGKQATQGAGDPARSVVQAAQRFGLAPVQPQPRFSRPPAVLPIAREFGRAKRAAGDALRVLNKTFIEVRLGKTICAHDVEPVLDAVYASVQRNLYAFNGLLRCQNDNEPIYRHSLAVSALMIALAKHM
ncbi:MAG: hypothetical protein VW935_19440, partial [Novosphingobium sp.]